MLLVFKRNVAERRTRTCLVVASSSHLLYIVDKPQTQRYFWVNSDALHQAYVILDAPPPCFRRFLSLRSQIPDAPQGIYSLSQMQQPDSLPEYYF